MRAAQRLVCFETKPLFELLYSSQLASLPVGYTVMTDVRCVNSNFPKPSWRYRALLVMPVHCFHLPCCWQLRAAAVPCPGVVLAELLQLPARRGAAGSDQCPELLCKWCFGVIEKGVKCLAGVRAECLGGQERGEEENKIP